MNIKEGLYLCNIKGLKHTDYLVLKYTENEGWWQYTKDYANIPPKFEGWVGLDKDVTIVNYELIKLL